MGNEESWGTTSGLLDDYNCEVVDAWFGTDSRYNNGQTVMLYWKMQTDQSDAGENNDGVVEDRWPCGSDWETVDGGKTIEHPKGTGKVHANSQYGGLINRAIELGAMPALADKGTPLQAEVWVGTKWHMKREAREYTDVETKQKKSAERLLPNAFHGVGDGSGPQTAEAPAAESSGPDHSELLASLKPELVEKLKAAKADSDGHPAFVDKVMELTEVAGNGSLVMALATPDGLWKEL